MEHIKIKTSKKADLSQLKVLDFTPLFEWMTGALIIIPQALKSIELTDYQNTRCLTWYERQKEHHDQVMKEFKNIFQWQKQ